MKGHRMTMAYENEVLITRPTSTEDAPLLEQQFVEPYETFESDNIISGEDILSPIDIAIESVDIDIREQVLAGLESEKVSLDEWLRFRVKNELVAQIFTTAKLADHSEYTIDITAVKNVMISEMDLQKSHAEEISLHIETLIPVAKGRFIAPDRDPNRYVHSDVTTLEARSAIKELAVYYIEALQVKSDDDLHDLTETYIEETLEAARTEVIDYLAYRNNKLEEELADRDMQLLDLEAEAQMSDDSRDLTL
jgi:hypothetical protein